MHKTSYFRIAYGNVATSSNSARMKKRKTNDPNLVINRTTSAAAACSWAHSHISHCHRTNTNEHEFIKLELSQLFAFTVFFFLFQY